MYSQAVEQIIDTLEEQLLTDWQLEQYAERIGYSKYYLTRTFKKRNGSYDRSVYSKKTSCCSGIFITAYRRNYFRYST